MGGRGEEGCTECTRSQTVYTLSNNWKWQLAVNQNSDSKLHAEASSRIRRRAFLGKPRSIHSFIQLTIGGKQTCGPSPGGRDQKEPGLKSESILSRWSWSDEFFVLIFFNGRVVPTGVRTHVVATTVCATGSVHTHSLVARTFFLVHNFVHAHFSCMWTHHALLKLFAVRMSSLLTHIFLSCFTRLCSCCSLTVTSRPLPATTLLTPTTSCRTFPSWKHRSSALRQRTSCLATLPSSFLSTGHEPKQFDKITSVDNDTMTVNDQDHNFSDFSKTTNENTRQFGVFHSVWILCFARFSFVILFFREKAKKACNRETVARQREREKGEGSVISVEESTSMKSRRNSIRSHSLQTHRKSFSEESQRILFWWMRSSRTPGRAQQAVLGENSVQRQWHSTEIWTWRSKIWNEEIQNTHYSSRNESLTQRLQFLEDV